jgi:hypothetical protein
MLHAGLDVSRHRLDVHVIISAGQDEPWMVGQVQP